MHHNNQAVDWYAEKVKPNFLFRRNNLINQNIEN